MMRTAAILTAFLFLQGMAHGQDQFIIKKDLQHDWLYYSGKNFVAYDQSDQVHTIHFYLKPRLFKGDYLMMQSSTLFSLLIDGTLVKQEVKALRLSMDSLSLALKKEVLFISVYQSEEVIDAKLSTIVYSKVPKLALAEEKLALRKASGFKDFVVMAILFLFIFLIVILRLNPRLSSDYFSISKIFSLREGDDDQYYFRITSANILFYFFTSLLLALFFMLVKQFAGHQLDFIGTLNESFSDSILVWSKVSLMILSFFLLKIILVYTLSSLFDMSEAAGYHFFNFIRWLLVYSCLITFVLAIYYILHGNESGFYNFSFQTFAWILGGWSIILFFKLSNRVRFSVIHLFSYICATEILPFLIVIKTLYE